MIEAAPFTDDYIKDIRKILSEARRQSYRAVNVVRFAHLPSFLTKTRHTAYGLKVEKRAGYGEHLIEMLSCELDRNRRYLEGKLGKNKSK